MSKVTAQDVIDILVAEDGYWGKKNATDDLYIKAAPNGTGEYTKYAQELYDAGYHNGNKNGYDGGCTSFVDWAFMKALKNAGEEEWHKTPAHNYSSTDSDLNPVNPYCAGAAYNAGCYGFWGLTDTTPRVGDKVFFCPLKTDGSLGDATHMGLVIAIDGNTITTMEGNTISPDGKDNAYCKKTRTLSKNMLFGHPRYAEAKTVVDPKETTEYKELLAKYNKACGELEVAQGKLEAIKDIIG